MREPLTVGGLLKFVESMRSVRPDIEALPIHIMDLDKPSEDDSDSLANLATHVEVDRFDEDGPLVVSIYKWQEG
jgi:P2-related tail formation protein